jgi:DNA-3-methyladenine glycosylase II
VSGITTVRASNVQLTPPLDLALSLEGFRRWGDDGLDRWDGQRLLRTVRIANRAAAFRATDAGWLRAPSLAVEVEPADAGRGVAGKVIAAAAAAFVVAPAEFAELCARDPVIAALDRRFPGLRPVLQTDLFTALLRSVTAQQLSLRWAAVVRRRLAERFGEHHSFPDGDWVRSLSAARLAEAEVPELRALQLSRRQAETIIEVARACLDGRLDQESLAVAPEAVVIAELVQLRGIGRWSAEWILARTFGRPVLVAGDLGVRKAVAHAYFGAPIANETEVRRATAHWGAAAAIAQALLLEGLAAGD